jgi:perosamine synthetase
MPFDAAIHHSASQLLSSDFEYIQGIVDRNYVGQGQLCDNLKQLLKERYACHQVILTDSGTAALHLCLLGLCEEYPAKKRVLVSAYVCPEVIGAVMRAGLIPVLVDICADSLNVDVSSMAKLFDADVLAIICTNIAGMPDDYSAAAAFGVPVVSDCAQSIGSSINGRDVAGEGVSAILSFGSTKMVTAGGGGAILCRGESLAEIIVRLARPELSVEEYRKTGFQVTFGQHLSDLTAGLAGAQLRRLDEMVARRRHIAESYDQALHDCGEAGVVKERHLVRSNRFRYYFLSDRATLWLDFLRSKGIDARGSISHVIPEYYGNTDAFPRLGRVSEMVVSVPIFPAMTTEEVGAVADALKSGPGRNS